MSVQTSSHGRLLRISRVITPIAVIASILLVGQSQSHAAAVRTSAPISFGRPTTVSVGQEGFEPDLRINSNDQLFSSVPNGFSTTISFIWRSFDHGQSWKLVPNSSADGTGKLLMTCAGGGDTEEVIDEHDRLYFNDLQGLTNFSTARSNDLGAIFDESCAGTPTNAGVDRQWYAVDGDPYTNGHVFLAYDEVAQGKDIGCGVGNNELVLTESPPPAVAGGDLTSGIEFGAQNQASCQEGIMGNDEVSPKLDPKFHQHYVFDVHDNGSFDSVYMLRCVQVPSSLLLTYPSGLDCQNDANNMGGGDNLVFHKANINVGANFVTMAVDKAGNLYAVWAQTPVDTTGKPTGPTTIELSHSLDNGVTWSTPVQVNGPQTNTNVYPWITAGDAGRIDIVWYGTPTLKNPAGAYGADTLTNASWNVYMAQSLNAIASAPTFAVTHVSEKPIHYGSIFVVGQGGSGDRTSGDFLNVRTGRHGEANITFVDSANDTDLGQNFFARQNGGPSLFTSAGSVPSFTAPLNTVTAPDCGTNPEEVALNANGISQNLCDTNLEFVRSKMSVDPSDASKLRITLQMDTLATLNPPQNSGGTVIDWLTAWHQPCAPASSGCATNGHLSFAYMESVAGQPPTFFDGNASSLCCAFTTYPGHHQLASSSINGICASSTAGNCYTRGGTIIIDVPRSDVGSPPNNSTLYSVTSSTLTLQAPSNSGPPTCNPPPPVNPVNFNCGTLFNTIASAPAYDATVAPRP
ncbi:MAG: hypothetical protein ACR2JC_11945 [Chloroflexota bacterium]